MDTTNNNEIIKRSLVVANENMANFCSVTPHLRRIFENGEVLVVENVRIATKELAAGDSGLYPPSHFVAEYAEDLLLRGAKTNHDQMGSDRFVIIEGEKYSAAWFRLATAAEVNQKARNTLWKY